MTVDISIILPCHNEASILESSIKKIIGVVGDENLCYEILILEDGSTDGTQDIAYRLAAENSNIIVQCATQRLGRGRAVANGLNIARGRVAGFIDVDLQTPASAIVDCYRVLKSDADAVETIRVYKDTRSISFLIRKLFTLSYRVIFKLLFSTNLKDTLAGCKFFDRAMILPVLSEVRDNHWFWDTEVMVMSHVHGLKIIEIESSFSSNTNDNLRESKTNLITDSVSFLGKLIELKWRLLRRDKNL